jgi:hypothetical protein
VLALLGLWPDRADWDWRALAACRGVGADLMHPSRAEDLPTGLALCMECDVVPECSAYAETARGSQVRHVGAVCRIPEPPGRVGGLEALRASQRRYSVVSA